MPQQATKSKPQEEAAEKIINYMKTNDIDLGGALLQRAIQTDNSNNKSLRNIIIAFTAVVIIFVVSVVFGAISFTSVTNEMRSTYIQETENLINARQDIELANAWERLPVAQRKERLREQYFQIIRYYTNAVSDEQKMNDDQINASFNQLWLATERIPSINFFLPVAYMKIATNFNPVYNQDYRRGIAALFLREAEQIANLQIVREDPVFMTAYRGLETVNNPQESLKLLVARIDDLMTMFNSREDWALLAMFTNEYEVIEKYWEGGDGQIPDELYISGSLAESLEYFYAFKNWQIPAISIE